METQVDSRTGSEAGSGPRPAAETPESESEKEIEPAVASMSSRAP